MATSQDFVNWVCSDQLDPRFLVNLLLAEGSNILKFASGTTHQTIYYPEVKAFHVCLPPLHEQKRIVTILDELSAETQRLEVIYRQNLDNLAELKQSFLQKAFSGELTRSNNEFAAA